MSKIYARCFKDKPFTEVYVQKIDKNNKPSYFMIMVDKKYLWPMPTIFFAERAFKRDQKISDESYLISLDKCMRCKWALRLLCGGCNHKSFELNT